MTLLEHFWLNRVRIYKRKGSWHQRVSKKKKKEFWVRKFFHRIFFPKLLLPIKFWCQWGNPWRPAPGHNFFLGSSKYRDGPKGGGYGRVCATQKLICILETTSVMMWKFRRLIFQFWTDLSCLSSAYFKLVRELASLQDIN